MKNMKKKELISISIFFLIVGYFVPFLIRSDSESTLTVFNASLTIISTTATVITLFIAIHLYQRFGLESRFIGNQTDKVLEIVDYFKGRMYYANTNKYKYFCGTSREKISMISKSPFYQKDKNKTILINNKDYEETWEKLLEIKRSYWLPKKIQNKIKFLDLYLTTKVDNPFDEQYIRIHNNIDDKKIKEVDWSITHPRMNFDEYNKNFYILIKALEKWLKQHSDIKIDFNLIEAEKYKKQ